MSDITLFVNPIYKKYALNSKHDVIFLFGGAGSGKSYFTAQKLSLKAIQETNRKMVFMRKVGETIKDSVFDLAKKSLQSLGIAQDLHITKRPPHITDTETGNEILFKGMDDEEKIKSLNDVTDVWMEEVTEFSESEYLQMRIRLRGDKVDNKQLIGTFNPVSSKHWLFPHVEPQGLKEGLPDDVKNFRYLDDDRRVWEFEKHSYVYVDGKEVLIITKTLVLNTNYQHNIRLTNQDIANIASVGSRSSYHKVVYQDGRWGEVNDGEKYAYNFDEGAHVFDSVPYLSHLPIHYTVDFNVNPYMSGLAFQINHVSNPHNKFKGFAGYIELRIFREYCLEHPLNNSPSLGEALVNEFREQLYKGFYLYGDASGNNKTGLKVVKTLFEGVEKGLGVYKHYMIKRVPKSNPRYANIAKDSLGRRDHLNALLKGEYPIKLMIDRSCHNFIDDLRLCLADANGKLSKKKTRVNGKMIELRGHLTQAFEYGICHQDTFAEYAKI